MSARTTCLVLGSICGLAFPWSQAPGQVATDGTVGPRVQLGGPDFAIGAELGRRAGGNLFHSFERFSLGTGESATFSGPGDIRSVISRVTGGERSDIDGTLRSTIPGADFFFINPAGVLFGPNASLDVQGSFHVSTADELRFSDGAMFSATDPSASSLTVAAPEAFGFLGGTAGAITVEESILQVPSGKAISLVGGDIDIVGGPQGFIKAEAGQITLAAAAGPAHLDVTSGELEADQRGGIQLRDLALVDVSGDGGGAVRIDSSAFVLEGQSLVFADNTGTLDADGGISVDAERITVTGGSQLSSSVRRFAEGDAGTVTINATGPVEVRNGGLIVSGTKASGSGGMVTVEAERLVVSGDGANDLTGITSQADTGSTGKAGAVKVRAGELEIRDGGEIVSATFGSGNAGTVTVRAERLHIVGEGDSEFTTGISTGADFDRGPNGEVLLSTGNAGAVKVRAGELEIRDGGEISSGTLGLGNAGTVTVQAERLLHIDGAGGKLLTGISSSAALVETRDGILVAGQGNAGSVNVIVAAGDLEIRAGGEISSAAVGGGDAGNVTVEADRLVLDRAAITTESAKGGGGVKVQVADLIDLEDSRITTSIFGDVQGDRAGNIAIDPTFLILDNSSIIARANAGDGGNIIIEAENILRSPESVIDASSSTGISGTVLTSSPDVDLAGELVVLDVPLLDAASLLRERCAARRDIGASSFTGIGRGGLPPDPDQPLMSDYGTGAAPGDQTKKLDGVEAEVAMFGAPTGQGRVALAPVLLVQSCAGRL